jgi:Fe-S cluster biogenesis protein NfuA
MSVLRRKSADPQQVVGRIHEALEGLVPILGIEAGDVTLVSYREGVATLQLHGDCPDPECTMSVSHFRNGIEAHLRLRVPEIVEVRTVGPADTHGSDTAG